jgi:hypothetical protein
MIKVGRTALVSCVRVLIHFSAPDHYQRLAGDGGGGTGVITYQETGFLSRPGQPLHPAPSRSITHQGEGYFPVQHRPWAVRPFLRGERNPGSLEY